MIEMSSREMPSGEMPSGGGGASTARALGWLRAAAAAAEAEGEAAQAQLVMSGRARYPATLLTPPLSTLPPSLS